jgi:hypothetical protein
MGEIIELTRHHRYWQEVAKNHSWLEALKRLREEKAQKQAADDPAARTDNTDKSREVSGSEPNTGTPWLNSAGQHLTAQGAAQVVGVYTISGTDYCAQSVTWRHEYALLRTADGRRRCVECDQVEGSATP